MIRRTPILAFLLLAVLCAPARALDLSALDLSLKTGVVTGTLKQPSTPDGYNFGGFPLMIGYNLNASRKLTLAVELGLVLDTGNFQITRTGMDFVGSYHLFGGSRRIRNDYVNIETIGHEAYDVSIGARAGFQKYSASSKDNLGDAVNANGSVFETMIGLQYRQDIGENTAISVEFFYTAFSLSASLDQLTSSEMLTLFSLRFFL